MISLLITLLLFVLLVLVVRWAMNELAVPANIQRVIAVILALVGLVWLLRAFGVTDFPIPHFGPTR